MAIKTVNELKSYFETGDRPTEEQFSDLIDSLYHKNGGLLVASSTYVPETGVFTITFSDASEVTFTIPVNIGIDFVEGLQDALDLKVDKVAGKGLSANDYDAVEKAQVATNKSHVEDDDVHVTPALKAVWSAKQDAEAGKGLSENDYSNAEAAKVAAGVAHRDDANIHVSAFDRSFWGQKFREWILDEVFVEDGGNAYRMINNNIYELTVDLVDYPFTSSDFDAELAAGKWTPIIKTKPDNKIELWDGDLSMCAYGQDSLTNGSGGFNFRKFLDPIYRGAFNKEAEIGYTHFDFETSVDVGAGFSKSAGLSYMLTESDFSIDPVKYSVSGKGVFGFGVTGEVITWNTNKHFTKVRVYYLQRSGGGSFRYGMSNILTGDRPTQSADGVLGLAYVDIERNTYDTTTLVIDQINGDIALFGAFFYNGDNGVSTLNLGRGGMTLEKQMQLDSSYRQEWFSILQPAVYFLNTGTNDRLTVDASGFTTLLTNYCNDIIAGSPDTNIIIVEPNQTADYDTTFAKDYTGVRRAVAFALGLYILDIPELIGDYDYFNNNSLMGDAVHPNEKGFKLIAQEKISFLGIQNYGNYKEIPDDLYSGSSLSVDKLSEDIRFFSLASPLDATEYTAYTLGFINGYIDFYFDLRVYIRLNGSGNMRVKNLRFRVGNATTIGAASQAGQLIVSDDYQDPSSGTIPDATFALTIESGKAVLKFTPTNDLSSLSITGFFTASKIVNTEGELIYYYDESLILL